MLCVSKRDGRDARQPTVAGKNLSVHSGPEMMTGALTMIVIGARPDENGPTEEESCEMDESL